MRYYPIFLDIQNRKCLVVGGGAVGCRKVLMLLDCGASVTVVSPVVDNRLFKLATNGKIELKKRAYRSSDLEGMFLVIGATNDEALNRQIKTDAAQHDTLCNIADRPEACNFILPAVVSRGDLIIAISTSGKSPAFAKKMRRDLEQTFGPEYADLLKLMGAIRKKLLRQAHQPEAHKKLFEKLIDRGLIEMIKEQRNEEIDNLLFEIFGNGYDFETLMNTDS